MQVEHENNFKIDHQFQATNGAKHKHESRNIFIKSDPDKFGHRVSKTPTKNHYQPVDFISQTLDRTRKPVIPDECGNENCD